MGLGTHEWLGWVDGEPELEGYKGAQRDQWWRSCPCCMPGRTKRCPGRTQGTYGRPRPVLYRPGGAPYFASRHAWGRQAAYGSQFLDPVGRA
jgi:hypothetical protein